MTWLPIDRLVLAPASAAGHLTSLPLGLGPHGLQVHSLYSLSCLVGGEVEEE